ADEEAHSPLADSQRRSRLANLAQLVAKYRVHSAAMGLAAISLLIWLGLFFFNGHFWQIWISNLDGEVVRAPEMWPSVVAVVPARNEAAGITQAVAALVQQDYAGKFSILVVDDHSDDGTAELARKTATESASKMRFDVTGAPPLQAGWTGK